MHTLHFHGNRVPTLEYGKQTCRASHARRPDIPSSRDPDILCIAANPSYNANDLAQRTSASLAPV